MPIYTYKCETCGKSTKKMANVTVENITCECGQLSMRQIPKLSGKPESKEIVNKYTGASRMQDHDEQIIARSDKYYWEVEVPRFVQSNKYSIETMLENEWITLSDDGKVIINNKPPHER